MPTVLLKYSSLFTSSDMYVYMTLRFKTMSLWGDICLIAYLSIYNKIGYNKIQDMKQEEEEEEERRER
jgi:hypothetical protein